MGTYKRAKDHIKSAKNKNECSTESKYPDSFGGGIPQKTHIIVTSRQQLQDPGHDLQYLTSRTYVL